MLTLEQPDNIFSALRMSPAAFVREMRVAAAEEKWLTSNGTTLSIIFL